MGEPGEPWARAVREAGEFPPPDLAAAVAGELASLWHDLDTARRYAYKGSWSVGCDDIVTRIVHLTRFAQATPWEQVQCGLLTDGVYQGILTAAGIEFAAPDMDEVRTLADQIRFGSVTVGQPS